MELKKIQVIGGSAASRFDDRSSYKSWPQLVENFFAPNTQVSVVTRSGLTFVRGIDLISDIEPCDLLIFHFGTSIGWPTSLVNVGHRIGINFASEFGFHNSAFKSSSVTRRIKSNIKALIRNTVKYLLFIFGLYRPRVSRRELSDQVRAVLHLASQKSPKIIWVQHRALPTKRTLLERISYQKFYKQIMEALKSNQTLNVEIVEIPESFLIADNYLLDCIHLSQQGHEKLFNMIKQNL